MASTTIHREVTSQQAADALQAQLGSGYRVTRRGNYLLSVKHGGLAFATVRMHRAGDATAFRVHGNGLIINRIVNEFGIARTVTEALKEGLEPPDATSKA
jgi:hypothetical protein